MISRWLDALPEKVKQDVLIHPSAGGRQFYRLAFLGDSILDVFIRSRLLSDYPGEDVGELAKKRGVLASTLSLASVARSWGLEEILVYQEGEKPTDYVLASAVEALVAAVEIVLGRDEVMAMLKQEFWPHRDELLGLFADFKSMAHGVLTRRGRAFRYRLLEKKGPDHSPTYLVSLEVDGVEVARGEGHSMKEAEQAAAEIFLEGR